MALFLSEVKSISDQTLFIKLERKIYIKIQNHLEAYPDFFGNARMKEVLIGDPLTNLRLLQFLILLKHYFYVLLFCMTCVLGILPILTINKI